MKKSLVLCLFLAVIISSCSQKPSADKSSIEVIGLNEAISNTKPININEISTNSELIRLETRDECLTGTGLTVYSTDQYVITIDRTKILLFDRKDGKFIREIGHMGNGPGEYSRTYRVMPFNEEKDLVYAGRNKARYGYSFEGQLKDTLAIPELVSEIGNIDDNIFAAFMPDYQGGEKRKILVFDRQDSLLNTFPNYLTAPNTSGFFVWNPNAWFYKLDKELRFFQLFNDTVFNVTANSITPKYVFDMGPYSPPYSMKTSQEFEPDKYFMVRGIQESSKYLFCCVAFNKKSYLAIYDKYDGTVAVNDFTPESGRGFVNNVNDFVPLEFSGINENDELICTINALDIKLWFEKNQDKVSRLPEHLKALKDIQETSNPVVVIAKLRNN